MSNLREGPGDDNCNLLSVLKQYREYVDTLTFQFLWTPNAYGSVSLFHTS